MTTLVQEQVQEQEPLHNFFIMSLGKKDIVKNISSKAHISKITSNAILHSFLSCIKANSKKKSIKISNFGTFYLKKTPSRLGRNPKTKETFPIQARSKLTFISSRKVREIFN